MVFINPIASAAADSRPQRGHGRAVHNGAMNRFSAPVWALSLSGVLCLTACAPHVGIGIPVGPLNIGVGLGSGGLSAGVGTGVGPLGVGVGVQSNGQVTGHAGVGTSVPIGPAHVGVGMGGSTVLHSPAAKAPAPAAAPPKAMQWRDAQGRIVPQCRVLGGC